MQFREPVTEKYVMNLAFGFIYVKHIIGRYMRNARTNTDYYKQKHRKHLSEIRKRRDIRKAYVVNFGIPDFSSFMTMRTEND
jgi:hypothetical protein